jgi:hypothetical protein
LLDYMPHASGQHLAGMLVRQDSRQWASMWVAYDNGMLEWRDPNTGHGNFEFMSVRNGWIYLDRLDQWAITCQRAELEDINSGTTVDVTCDKGHPYVPLLLPRDPFRVRVWGKVGGQPFYWQSDFYPGERMQNDCWYQGSQTLEVTRQKDSWWSMSSGWVRATGTLPYDAAGRPQRPAVDNKYEVTLAKGIGVWTINDMTSGQKFCAYSTWRWN